MLKIVKWGLWCMVALSAFCFAESDESMLLFPDEPCDFPAEAFNGLSQQVLQGADRVPIDAFSVATRAKPEPLSHFTSEFGGAEISLKYDPLGSHIAFVRYYREPGLLPKVKSYDGLCFKAGRFYGKGLRVMVVDDGLLWLELQSGEEAIPADFWLLLK